MNQEALKALGVEMRDGMAYFHGQPIPRRDFHAQGCVPWAVAKEVMAYYRTTRPDITWVNGVAWVNGVRVPARAQLDWYSPEEISALGGEDSATDIFEVVTNGYFATLNEQARKRFGWPEPTYDQPAWGSYDDA